MSKGEQSQKEYYSIQNTGDRAYTAHETTKAEPEVADESPNGQKDPDYIINSFLEEGAGHKTAVTPGINKVPHKKLPLAHPEEQGKSRGKTASGGEVVDNVDWGIATMDTRKMEPMQEYYSNAVWESPDEKTAERREVNSMEGRR